MSSRAGTVRERASGVYLRYKSGVDRVAGGVKVALGLKLVSAADRP
jgi:hypothetical protein